MRKYRILELVITRDQTRNALHAPSRSLQESPQEGTAGTEPRKDLKQLEIEINHELILVQTWLKDNQLTLNIKKTNYIIFKSFRKKLNANLTFKINDKIIQNAKETKFLGI